MIRRPLWFTLTTSLSLLLGLAATASAEWTSSTNGGSTEVTLTALFPPSPPVVRTATLTGNNCFTTVVSDPAGGGDFDHVIASACRNGNKITSYVIASGNCSAGSGKFGTLAVGDTVFASDSSDIDVARLAGQVQLTFTNGRNILSADRGTAVVGAKGSAASSLMKVLVYPTQAAADADPTGTGAGAVFNGAVGLTSPGGVVQTSGDFIAGDFTSVTDDGSGRLSVRVRDGLVKSVAVANSANAVVRVIGDPTSIDPVPGASPVLVGLLSVALLGLGWMVLYRRQARTV